MKLYIGENIKRYRIEKGLTQEDIAAHLGISFQSISKWERGEGYPDITMLPALASYFGVSIDDLIGVNEMEKKHRYDEINALWRENNSAKRNEENIALMRKSLKDFPNDPLLLVQLSTSLEKADGTAEEKRKNLQESISLQEQILRNSDDCEVRGATLFNICFSYLKNGEKDKALEQAKKLPNLYKARENALTYAVMTNHNIDNRYDVSKYFIKTTDGGEYIPYVYCKRTPSDPDYRPTAPDVDLWGGGGMTRISRKYSISSWSCDTRYCSRKGGWPNNLVQDYEILYEYIGGILPETQANAEKYARLREREFIDEKGNVNIIVAKGNMNAYFDNLPQVEASGMSHYISRALEFGEQEAKLYPPQIHDLIMRNAGYYIGNSPQALLVLDVLYKEGIFRPLTENEKVTSQLIMFCDRLPKIGV